MEGNIVIAIAVGVIVSVLVIGVARFRRWPEGRKRALRAGKRKKR